jgi:hypothetical protein
MTQGPKAIFRGKTLVMTRPLGMMVCRIQAAIPPVVWPRIAFQIRPAAQALPLALFLRCPCLCFRCQSRSPQPHHNPMICPGRRPLPRLCRRQYGPLTRLCRRLQIGFSRCRRSIQSRPLRGPKIQTSIPQSPLLSPPSCLGLCLPPSPAQSTPRSPTQPPGLLLHFSLGSILAA